MGEMHDLYGDWDSGEYNPFEGDDDCPEHVETLHNRSGIVGYTSWTNFMDTTTEAERLAWCREKAKRANERITKRYDRQLRRVVKTKHVMTTKLSAQDVWRIVDLAKGRCCYCGSLAVERMPINERGKLLPCDDISRRIGTLEHVVPKDEGGDNNRENLRWACHCCNSTTSERIPGAKDHGGL